MNSRELVGIIWLGELYRTPTGYQIQRLEFDQVLRSQPKLDQVLDLVQIASQLGISSQQYLAELREFSLRYSQIKLKQIPIQQELIKAIKLYDALQSHLQGLENQLREWEIIYQLRSQPIPKLIGELRESLQALESKLVELRKMICAQLDQLAPKLKSVAGDLIGARLIWHAGGLDSLAKMPTTRIQILGASLRSGQRSPKHGIIYQHPSIKSAPRSQRGKLAKQLAAQIALAARSDFFK